MSRPKRKPPCNLTEAWGRAQAAIALVSSLGAYMAERLGECDEKYLEFQDSLNGVELVIESVQQSINLAVEDNTALHKTLDRRTERLGLYEPVSEIIDVFEELKEMLDTPPTNVIPITSAQAEAES